MDELGKVKRVIEKIAPVTEVLLVLDATTGQNGLTQARMFSEVVDVTGIVLTKLDGSPRAASSSRSSASSAYRSSSSASERASTTSRRSTRCSSSTVSSVTDAVIRVAGEEDLEAITAIYNDAILTTTASWDDEVVTLENRRAWLAEHGAEPT